MSSHTRATLTVPAAYIDDVRSAAMAEVESDAYELRAQSIEVESGKAHPQDRDSRVVILRRSHRLLDALEAADGDVELIAESDLTSAPLSHLTERVVRVLTERLTDAAQYGPIPMGEVLDVAERLRWAASEAIRLEPSVGDRLPLDRRVVA